MAENQQSESGWERLDERTKAMEKRLGRVEIGLIAMLVGALTILVKFVLKAVGLE